MRLSEGFKLRVIWWFDADRPGKNQEQHQETANLKRNTNINQPQTGIGKENRSQPVLVINVTFAFMLSSSLINVLPLTQ